jgi:hypothetical protein
MRPFPVKLYISFGLGLLSLRLTRPPLIRFSMDIAPTARTDAVRELMMAAEGGGIIMLAWR